jgi:hypothetical protein
LVPVFDGVDVAAFECVELDLVPDLVLDFVKDDLVDTLPEDDDLPELT